MHVIELVLKGPKKAGKDMRNSKITVLGTAYKAEIGNTTNTPARIMVQELMNLGAEVVVYDPYCEESFGAKKNSGSCPSSQKSELRSDRYRSQGI